MRISMDKPNINLLSKEYVIENGTYFDGENIHWNDYCICKQDNTPFTGLLYETYNNGQIAYYGYIKNGIDEEDKVFFYRNGQIKSYCKMYLGAYYGKSYIFYENGQLKEMREKSKDYKNEWIKKWDENGTLLETRQLK